MNSGCSCCYPPQASTATGYLSLSLFFSCLFRAAPEAFWQSQAMPNPSHVCDLHHSSWQRQALNPMSETRDQTCVLMDTSWVRYHWARTGTPANGYLFSLFPTVSPVCGTWRESLKKSVNSLCLCLPGFHTFMLTLSNLLSNLLTFLAESLFFSGLNDQRQHLPQINKCWISVFPR